MARFLFTMLPANDLGLPTRMVPIARALADRGHEVAMFNPSPAPSKLIADAGLRNLEMPARGMPAPVMDLEAVSAAWDVEHMFGAIYRDRGYVRDATAAYVDVIRGYAPDVVVDSFDLLACLAARVCKRPLVTVLQGNFHPASKGFLWWEDHRPEELPSATPFVNAELTDSGLGRVERCVELLAGDLSIIVGTPETDPLPASANATWVGPVVWQRGNAALPEWVMGMNRERPVIWVYSGNPRYANATTPTPIDSIVVIRAAIEALRNEPVQVVLTTGYQELPEEFGALPGNFRHAAYLPGLAMAAHCDLMVHHGGHGSVMAGLSAGTPAVILPTITERESNARRLASLGAGEVVVPRKSGDGEKHIDKAEFGAKVKRVLQEPRYREAARRVAESMRKYGGAAEATHRIEEFAGNREAGG